MEPINTDEPLPEGKKTKKNDMETVMIGGCSSFVFFAGLTYGASVWAFIVFQNISAVKTLAQCGLLGLLPGIICGVIACRKFGLAGACGFIAGAMSVSVFLTLRIEQAFLSAEANQAPRPQYPELFRWLIPLGWLVLCFTVALIFTPKSELSFK